MQGIFAFSLPTRQMIRLAHVRLLISIQENVSIIFVQLDMNASGKLTLPQVAQQRGQINVSRV